MKRWVWAVCVLACCACVPRSRTQRAERSRAAVEKPPVTRIAPKDDAMPVTPRVERARAMVERFKGQLQSRLRQTIKEGGPAAAISVCNDAAAEMRSATRDGELWLRRVGTRVRNPERNTPTAHEREILSRLTLFDKEHAYDDGERLHYMQGIFIDRGLCVVCHGKPRQIPDTVKAALAERYPDDAAVGYTRGELRGAFVVYGRAPAAE